MPTFQDLQDETLSWVNRRDCAGFLQNWTGHVETQIAMTCRARCMVTSKFRSLDDAYISLPTDFATMESIRDAATGVNLVLKDEWSGSWSSYYDRGYNGPMLYHPATQYRLVADMIEFMPHPQIPNPPNPSWIPQRILMGYYARPRPLILPSDTNTLLETHYEIYLFGLVKMAAVWALDDPRAAQMDAMWQQAVTRANLWKQGSDYSGAPYRAELATPF